MKEEELRVLFNLMCSEYYSEIEERRTEEIVQFILETYDDRFTRIVEKGRRLDNIYHLIGVRYITFKNIVHIIKGNEKFGIYDDDVILNGRKVLDGRDNYFIISRKEKILTLGVPKFKKDLNSKCYIHDKNDVYIKIRKFDDDIIDEIKNVEFNDKSIIIDLRNNMGGKVTVANHFLELFFDPGQTLYYVRNKQKEEFTIKSKKNNKKITKNRIIIFVNEDTASSAELVTAVLKEKLSAVVVGTSTKGKGVMQRKYKLSDERDILLPVYEFYTSDIVINNKGIYPDLVIKDTIIDKWIAKEYGAYER